MRGPGLLALVAFFGDEVEGLDGLVVVFPYRQEGRVWLEGNSFFFVFLGQLDDKQREVDRVSDADASVGRKKRNTAVAIARGRREDEAYDIPDPRAATRRTNAVVADFGHSCCRVWCMVVRAGGVSIWIFGLMR